MEPTPNNIELRLRHGDAWIIVRSTAVEDEYNIEIIDLLGHTVDNATRDGSLEFLLVLVSRLRHQIYKLLGHKPATP